MRNAFVYAEGRLTTKYVVVDHANRVKLLDAPVPVQAEIDATGKVVSPGFIDILGENSTDPEATYQIFEKYKLADGVTTSLQMHGGSGNPQRYYEVFKDKTHLTNYGVSTKVATIRFENADLGVRYRAVEEALDAGALGVSHPIEYQPLPYEELLNYAKLAAKYDRPCCLHLRYSSAENELDGVREAIRLSQDSGARVHIDHLHSTGGTFHMEEALDLIARGIESGLELTTCVYPYSNWATYLHSTRFDTGWQARYGLNYGDLTVVGTGERLTEGRFNELRGQTTPPVLVAVPEGTIPLHRTVDLALQREFCMIGSDGGIEKEPRANNHPRGAGCFATAVRYGLSRGLQLESILEKITMLPARLLRPVLNDRAVLKDGSTADLVVFDVKSIDSRASISNPNQFSEGIDTVIVNGEIALANRQIKSFRGQAIRVQW
jgi:N-acyl-D-aspartate/D-glutamate deacylase